MLKIIMWLIDWVLKILLYKCCIVNKYCVRDFKKRWVGCILYSVN